MFTLKGGCYNRHIKSCDGTYTKVKKRESCIFCSLSFLGSTVSERANHTRWCTKNPKSDEYRNNARDRLFKNSVYMIQKYMTIEAKTKHSVGIKRAHTDGKYLNVGRKMVETKIRNGTLAHSEETKKRLSEARRKFLRDNPDKHPWKNKNKQCSEPCEHFKKYLLSKNISFTEEHQPLEDRFFSIDIAFPDIKIGIEINGNQHYSKDGNLLQYYQQRHDLIESTGWKLIEIHYYDVYNLQKIDDILEKYVYTKILY